MFHKFPLNITYGTLVAMETLGEDKKVFREKSIQRKKERTIKKLWSMGRQDLEKTKWKLLGKETCRK